MTVRVITSDGTYVGTVSAAVARRALSDNCATVAEDCASYTIRLPPGVNRCPVTFARFEQNMATTPNYIELFKAEQDLWVKSVVPGQVSVQFEDRSGHPIHVLVPYSGDPIKLTDLVPFDAIKASRDLRKLCGVRRASDGRTKPPALALLTDSEADEHFRKKALKKKLYLKDASGAVMTDDAGQPIPDIDAAKAPVITEPASKPAAAMRIVPDTSRPSGNTEQSDIANLGDKPVMMADEIHPRVLQLCHEIATAENDAQRPLADNIKDEFEALGALNESTLQHILAFGYYKSIKTWAQQQLSTTAQSEA